MDNVTNLWPRTDEPPSARITTLLARIYAGIEAGRPIDETLAGLDGLTPEEARELVRRLRAAARRKQLEAVALERYVRTAHETDSTDV
jgi:hypothetical protein